MSSLLCIFFFFSSRRRHTRCSRDWSSDVCSSDLYMGIDFPTQGELLASKVDGQDTPISEINKRVAEEIGLDGLGYNDIVGLSQGTGLQESEMCYACVSGVYLGLKKDPVIRTREEMKA